MPFIGHPDNAVDANNQYVTTLRNPRAQQVNDVLKGEVSMEHTVGKSSSRATLDVEGNWMRTSSCVAVGSSLLVGAQGDFIVGAPKVRVLCVAV